MRNIQNSKYDLRVNPVYQVDWSQEASGKRVKATKRRVRFRFGFSHRESIEQGLTGNECRGEEHEVILIWSLTSGKRLVVADGEEIHFSTGKFTDPVFETSWQIHGGHMIKIIAYAAPPLMPTPGFRQFDLQIDGMSFFDMPKIFELGTRTHHAARASAATYNGDSNYSSRQRFALPPSTSYEENRAYTSHPEFSVPPQVNQTPPAPTSMDRRNSMPQLPPTPLPVSSPQDTLSSQSYHTPNQQHYAPPAPAFAAPPVAAPAPMPSHEVDFYQSPPPRDEFAPVPPPPPTFADKSQQILSAYTPAPQSLPQLANAPHYFEYGSASPGATISDVSEYDDDSSPFSTPEKAQVLKPTMAPLAIVEMEQKELEHLDDVDRAMKNLVNLGDLTRTNETPEQVKLMRRKEEERRNNRKKSSPMPPAKASWQAGNNAALGELQKHKSVKTPTKEVMRTHAFDPQAAQAGMMVVYGATAPPPPQPHGGGAGVISSLPAPNHGFGAGATMAAAHARQQAFYYQQQQAGYMAAPPLYMAH